MAAEVEHIFGDPGPPGDDVDARLLPHALESEDLILAALLTGNVHVARLAPELEAAWFYSGGNARIFEACRALLAAEVEPTATLAAARLSEAGRLAEVGGLPRLTELVGGMRALGPLPAKEHFRLVRETARQRSALSAARIAAGALAEGEGLDGPHVGASLALLAALTAEAKPTAPTLASRIVAVEASWLDEAPPMRAYLAHDTRTGLGAIEARGAYLLVAAGGVGKSFATIALAVAVATAGTWLGCMAVGHAGRVLMVSAEDDADEVRRRIYYVARAAQAGALPPGAIEVLDLHDVHAPLLDAEGRQTEHAAALVELARTRGPFALIVADPLARLAGAPIDGDNVAAGALVAVLEAIATAAQGLVLGVHHTSLAARKTGDVSATAIRGATGLGDSARAALVLSAERVSQGDADVDARLGELVTLRLAKVNHVRRWEPIELRRGEHGELLPLDAPDRALIEQARAGKGTAPKADRSAELAQREASEDAAVLRAVGECPGIPTRELVPRVQAAARCGRERAEVAIQRCMHQLEVREGPRKAQLHYLRTVANVRSGYPPHTPPVASATVRRSPSPAASVATTVAATDSDGAADERGEP